MSGETARDTERCELTELLVDQCAHCRGVDDLPALPPKWSGPLTWIPAQFPGRCSGCGEPINPGDWIISDGHETGWRGECCDER